MSTTSGTWFGDGDGGMRSFKIQLKSPERNPPSERWIHPLLLMLFGIEMKENQNQNQGRHG
jgi:hypothetical protein